MGVIWGSSMEEAAMVCCSPLTNRWSGKWASPETRAPCHPKKLCVFGGGGGVARKAEQ